VPGDLKQADLADWLGRQSRSAAVWTDGTSLQNGQRLADAQPIDTKDGAVLHLEHSGGVLAIIRGFPNGSTEVLKRFAGVPADWRMAVGGFGGRAHVINVGEDPGSGPRCNISAVRASGVPDSDAGASRSDVYVQFELLLDDGAPYSAAKTPVVRTITHWDVQGGVAAWTDILTIPLPLAFAEGHVGARLAITVWDEDTFTKDDCIGGAYHELHITEGALDVDNLTMKGFKSGGGYDFPDFQLGFKLDFFGVQVAGA